MIETSAYYGQPTVGTFPFAPQATVGTFPFAPQAGYATAAAPYGLPIWQLLGGPLSHPQFWGQFAPPLHQYGSFAGPAIGGWPVQPPLGVPLTGWGGQPARPPLLEAYPAIPLTAAFAPHGFVGNQIGPLGSLAATFGQRGFGSSGLPFQAAPPLAYIG
jgi:hypothetical protein